MRAIDDRPPVICTGCGTEVHWLAVFPETVCVDCHAAAQAGRSLDEMWSEMMGAWTGGVIR